MVTSISRSAEETQALGEAWGRTVPSGLVIALCGDLGAGKTQLVKGLARGLGITARIQSPTFALVNSYPGGRVPLFHLDLYRLETPQMILAAGLEEYLHPKGISVIEWAERWFTERRSTDQRPGSAEPPLAARPGSPSHPLVRWVDIEVINETDRRISYEDISA